MHSFKDHHGRDWPITITVADMKRVKGLVGVDLYGLVDDQFQSLGKLLSNPIEFVDVLFALVKPEADRRGITDEQFGSGLGGDSLQAAMDAFLQEYLDFFPDPKTRAANQRILEKAQEVRDRVLAKMNQQLDELDPDSVVEKLSGSSGSLPASPGLTRTQGLSVKSA